MTDAPAPAQAASFRAGTLAYTKYGLFTLFAWLLWGDFCFSLFEAVPGVFPTYLLKYLGFSNNAATIMTGTIPQILGLFVGPAVSFRSDRTRSRFGRRIPYITYTAPLLCLFVVAQGFSGEIAAFLKSSNFLASIGISAETATLIVIGFLTVGFTFFNEFVGSVYFYLFNDVVPPNLMGRFQALFRMVGTGAGMAYKAFVFQYSLDYMPWVFLGAAILYMIGMSLMCWGVKEGQYPPVTDMSKRTSLLTQVETYFRECFTHPIYIFTFVSSGFMALAGAASIGMLLFNTNLPGVGMAEIGYIGALVNAAGIVVSYPCGWLVDKYHPLRMTLAMMALLPFIKIACFLFLAGYWSYVFIQGTNLLVWSIIGAASFPLYMMIFPREKFGQFCAARGQVWALFAFLGTLVGGRFADWVIGTGQFDAAGKEIVIIDNYRYTFLWEAVFFVLAWVCLYIVYRYWKQLGADKGYKAPTMDLADEAPAQGQ